MAEKTEKVVTTTKTVTTTTVTETTETKKKSGWWSGLKTAAKIALIAGGTLVLAGAVLLIVFGRAKNVSDSMESTIAQNSKVFFNRFKTPETLDIVVFRHPETDSVVPSAPKSNYYKSARQFGEDWCRQNEVVYQKFKRRPVYISRVYGTPGSLVEIKDNTVFINHAAIPDPNGVKYQYIVSNDRLGGVFPADSLGIPREDMKGESDFAEDYMKLYINRVPAGSNLAIYCMTENSAQKLSRFSIINKVEKIVLPKDFAVSTVFPYQASRGWNSSNMGPLIVPQKGKVVKLSVNTLPVYRRCIEAYEENKVEVKGKDIFINGQLADSYRFKMDYYFVVGDNRAGKDDSRYFGFLPENHVLGTACE